MTKAVYMKELHKLCYAESQAVLVADQKNSSFADILVKKVKTALNCRICATELDSVVLNCSQNLRRFPFCMIHWRNL